MVEFDVRLTSDGHPVLHHDFILLRTHHSSDVIEHLTLDELRKRTSGTNHPIVTLEEALKTCYGYILINIELKRKRAVGPTLAAIQGVCGPHPDWESIVFSSFYGYTLRAVRKLNSHAQLAMLHRTNPLAFMAWHRTLHLSAVGFYRLHYTTFALEVARQLGLFTYAYTVDRPEAMLKLEQNGFDGIVTNFPRLMVKTLEQS